MLPQEHFATCTNYLHVFLSHPLAFFNNTFSILVSHVVFSCPVKENGAKEFQQVPSGCPPINDNFVQLLPPNSEVYLFQPGLDACL